jgi:cytochrome c oxidase assembly protein subunit 15
VPGVGRGVRAGAALAAAGTVAQVPLGGLTVLFDLHPLLVMSHFLLAMAVVAVSVWVAHEAWRVHRGDDAPAGRDLTARAGQAAVVACLALITTGAFVTAAGPHAGSSDVPIDRLGDLHDAAWVHVRVATTFTVLLVALAAWLWKRFRGSPAQRLSVVSVILLGCQAAVGEYQYRNGLPWDVIAIHVALAATLLITVVVTASLVSLPLRADPGASRAAGR